MRAEVKAPKVLATLTAIVSLATCSLLAASCQEEKAGDDKTASGGDGATRMVLSYQECSTYMGYRVSCKTIPETSFGNGKPYAPRPAATTQPAPVAGAKVSFSYASVCNVNPGNRVSCNYADETFP